jgi:group I intron endonuclease
MNKKISGIYKISSKIKPERIYVGSAVDMRIRWNNHRYYLAVNKHHCSKLQRHYNKYGKDDLIFEILLPCLKEELIEKEQFFIDTLNPWFNVYRVAKSPRGYTCTPETREKISRSKTGTFRTEEQKENIGKGHIGILHTPETKEKMSEAQKQRWKENPITPERREKLRKSNTGKHSTEENRAKMRTAQQLRWLRDKHPSKETLEKMSNAKIGKPFSEEHKKNISKIRKGMHFSEEHKVNIRNSRLGKQLSEEHRKNISDAIKRWWKIKRSKENTQLT